MCFSLDWVEHLVIWAILLIAAIMVIKIIIPAVLSATGTSISGWVMQILNICLWAVVMVFIVIIVFDLLKCVAHF